MTRLLHTGDTHLGYQQYHLPERRADFRTAFHQVADDAVDLEVDAVVHAGDLFHDRQPSLADIMGAISVLRTLDDAGIPFLAIVGNHESKRGGQWLDLFEEMGLARRLRSEPIGIGEVALYGLDFVPRSQRESYTYEFEQTAKETKLLVSHGLFEPFEHGDWDARTVLAESPVQFDAMLLGDDHTPKKKRLEEPYDAWLTYCGSTERASASEREPRGYNLVTVENGTLDIRRRGLETRSFEFVDIELGPEEGPDRVRERISEYTIEDAVVIVTLTGEGESVMAADIESYAEERGALVTRVNDRRELPDETDVTVSFADPDQAVQERIQDLGLSEAAHHLDETIRASKVADANVTDAVERRVSELVEEEEVAVFETAAESPQGNRDSRDDEESDSSPNQTADELLSESDDGAVAMESKSAEDEPAENSARNGATQGESGPSESTGDEPLQEDGEEQQSMEEYL